MSSSYETTSSGTISYSKLQRKPPPGLKVSKIKLSGTFCLYDGENYLWVTKGDGDVATFDRFGQNNVTHIIELLEDFYGVRIVCTD